MSVKNAELLYNAAEEGNTTEVGRLTLRCDRAANDEALDRAALNGYVDCVALLLPKSSLKGKRDGLVRAASQGHLECVQLLIANNDASTALLWAARGGHTPCVRFLLEYVDVTHKEHASSSLRFSPLAWAASNGHADCVRILVEVSPLEHINHGLLCALDGGGMECMKILYPHSDVDAVEEELREGDDEPNAIIFERMEQLKCWAQRERLTCSVKNSQASKVLVSSRKI